MSATATIRRRLHILAEFGEADVYLGAGASTDSVLRDSLFCPPWRDIRVDGTLSPEFGPADIAAEMRRFRESTAGGGLWDPDEEPRRAMPAPSPPAVALSPQEHLRRVEHRYGEREQRVLSLAYRDKRRPKRIANDLGMAIEKVEAVMRAFVASYLDAGRGH